LDEAATFPAGVDFSEVGFATAATFELVVRFFAGLLFKVEALRADFAGTDLGLVEGI
jgi:hypothetical protein